MQCVERAESESGEPAVFMRVPLILEIVSGRVYEKECPGVSHFEDCRYRLRLSPDSLDRCVIEWTLEAVDVEAGGLAHIVIVLPAAKAASLIAWRQDYRCASQRLFSRRHAVFFFHSKPHAWKTPALHQSHISDRKRRQSWPSTTKSYASLST